MKKTKFFCTGSLLLSIFLAAPFSGLAAPSDWEVSTSQHDKNLFKWNKMYEGVKTPAAWQKAFLDAVKTDSAEMAQYFFDIAARRNIDLSFGFLEGADLLSRTDCGLLVFLLNRAKQKLPSVALEKKYYLHKAVARHADRCVQRLLALKVLNLDEQNGMGESAIDIAIKQRDLVAATNLRKAGAKLNLDSEYVNRMVFEHDNVLAFKLFYPTKKEIDSATFKLTNSDVVYNALQMAAAKNAETVAAHLMSLGYLPGKKGKLDASDLLSDSSPVAIAYGKWNVFELFIQWNPSFLEASYLKIGGNFPDLAAVQRDAPVVRLIMNHYPDQKALCSAGGIADVMMAKTEARDYMQERWRYVAPGFLNSGERTAFELYSGLYTRCKRVVGPSDREFTSFLSVYDYLQQYGVKRGVAKYGADKLRNLRLVAPGQPTNGSTLLDVALERKNLEVFNDLLQLGIDANVKDYATVSRAIYLADAQILSLLAGQNFLRGATIDGGLLGSFITKGRVDVLKILVPALGLKDQMTKDGSMALAAESGKVEVVRTLKELGVGSHGSELANALKNKASAEIIQELWPTEKKWKVREAKSIMKTLVDRKNYDLTLFAMRKFFGTKIFPVFVKNSADVIRAKRSLDEAYNFWSGIMSEPGFEAFGLSVEGYVLKDSYTAIESIFGKDEARAFFKAFVDRQNARFKMASREQIEVYEGQLVELYKAYAAIVSSVVATKSAKTSMAAIDCMQPTQYFSEAFGTMECLQYIKKITLADLATREFLYLSPKVRADQEYVTVSLVSNEGYEFTPGKIYIGRALKEGVGSTSMYDSALSAFATQLEANTLLNRFYRGGAVK